MNTIDPIMLEVMRNKFEAIAEEMQTTLIRSSYSVVVKEGKDASAAIFTKDAEMIAGGIAVPGQLGQLYRSVMRILEFFPVEKMCDGDVYLMNDPYDGGSHLPDVTVVTPIVYNGKVLTVGAAQSHWQDIGGKTAGSIPTDATELFQEGLVLPPLQLYSKGVLNEALIELIKKNVRIPTVVIGDLMGQCAAGQIGKRRFLALVEEYGEDAVMGGIEELHNRAERMTRQSLEALPDGVYPFEDYLDNDGIDLDRRVKIKAAIKISGSDFSVDFAGTDPQVRGPFNCVYGPTITQLRMWVRLITDPAIPQNDGAFRMISMDTPEGSVVNPIHPAPVNARGTTMIRISDVIQGALAKIIPDRIPAAPSGNLQHISFGGTDPKTGRAWVCSEFSVGGTGGRPTKDGVDVMDMGITNIDNVPVEMTEIGYPLRVLRYGLWTGSGGIGKYRGGCGFAKTYELLRGQCVVSHRGDRHLVSPWGLMGGKPGRAWKSVIEYKDGRTEVIPSKGVFTLNAGDKLHLFTGGGGGYGDPLDRPPSKVLDDLLDRKILPEQALDDYGVVINPDTNTVDEERTRILRAEMRTKGQIEQSAFDDRPRLVEG
ncbi:hydantoinase B/oxoprolinase family protein [Parapusillimonas sp. SGNA-6]|nr:hydantoinase B/oxoprolinase family protein [Parapusillimonas sp. SGNA-6]